MKPDQLLTAGTPLTRKTLLPARMHKLYPNLLQIPVAARAEEYFIPFPNYMDKKSYQRVAKDEMFIYNHDFDETIELV